MNSRIYKEQNNNNLIFSAVFQSMFLWLHRLSLGASITKPLGRTRDLDKFMQYSSNLFHPADLISYIKQLFQNFQKVTVKVIALAEYVRTVITVVISVISQAMNYVSAGRARPQALS